MDQPVLDALVAKYSRVAAVQYRDDIEIAVRAPSRAEYKVFRAALHTPGGAADAQEDLIRKIVVWVNGEGLENVAQARQAFDRLLEQYPALCENRAASKEISDFTGLEFRSQGKA
jgi:hypothetical protein